MTDLSVLIPVYNEEGNIYELTARIHNSLISSAINYEIIFIDDHSTDQTQNEIENVIQFFSQNYASYGKDRIKLIRKKGRIGKAFSIIEGSYIAKSDYIAMIDADLQYPPEGLPELFAKAKRSGISVGERTNFKVGISRTLSSKVYSIFFEKLLLGLSCDTQSGMKVFKKEIIEKLNIDDVTAWTIDIPLLIKAQEMGYEISTTRINFEKRKLGQSKINFLKDGKVLIKEAFKVKLNKDKIENIRNGRKDDIGVGVLYKNKKFITHTSLNNDKTALITFYPWQKNLIILVISLTLLGFLIMPKGTGIVLITIFTFAYFIDLLFSTRLLYKSLNSPLEILFDEKELKDIDTNELPIYTILCPLYREDRILPDFVAAIEAIDWPKEKLDVMLLLEEDDVRTQKKASGMNLPEHFRIMIVPNSLPKTKPKACNYGLLHAKGEYIVVYDAEDRPDTDQLKKSYIAFNKLDKKVACLQSKLNYYNSKHNLLTKLFTAEYSLWFDLILPGLQLMHTTIPLGGTSNHFRTNTLKYLNGWDAFNVTEDCDLGTRLFKEGFSTAIIDSTTLEEANSKYKSWLRQRSRWIKGYLQTYLVHMRNPGQFIKKHGIHAFIFQLVIGLRMTFIIVNPILWVTTISYFVFRDQIGEVIESLYPAPVYYVAVFTFVIGNFVYFYNYMIGLAKKGQWGLIKYVFLVPIYWVMASASSVMAFYQLFIKPHHWEKTEHGLHLQKQRQVSKSTVIDVIISIETGIIPNIIKLPGELSHFISRTFLEFIDLFSLLELKLDAESEKLNIIIFNWRDIKHVWAGGAERYVHELAKEWVKNGHNVNLFCGWDGNTVRQEEIDGINVIRRGGFFTLYPLALLYYVLKFKRKFDVVIDCENGIPFFTPFYSSMPKVLVIHHIHQEVFRKHIRFPMSLLAMFLESKLMPFLYKGLRVVTISESSKKEIIDRGWVRENLIDIVYPAIDEFAFPTLVKKPYPSLCYLGRLMPWKNVDTLVKAFNTVLVNYPEAKLEIVGWGESLSSLQRLVERFEIGQSVRFHGFVSNEEKYRILSESWIAIQPSSIEGWGMTVIEANACATPVIASDIKGLRDSVVNGKTGILIQEKDVKSFSEAIQLLFANESLRIQLSNNALLWSKNFSWRKSAYEFEKVLYEAVSSGNEIAKAAYDWVRN